jgi:hypothetical protein
MNIQKIIKKIKYFLKKNISKTSKTKLILNNLEKTSFINKRRSFVIKNNHLEKLKIL